MIQTCGSAYHPRVALNVTCTLPYFVLFLLWSRAFLFCWISEGSIFMLIRNTCFGLASLHLLFPTLPQTFFAHRTVFHPCGSRNVFLSFLHFSGCTYHIVILGGVLRFSPSIVYSFVVSGAGFAVDRALSSSDHLEHWYHGILQFLLCTAGMTAAFSFSSPFSLCVCALLSQTRHSSATVCQWKSRSCLVGYVSTMTLSKSGKLSGWMLQKIRKVFRRYISALFHNPSYTILFMSETSHHFV